MRLFTKFFLCAALIISIALLFSGYLMITFAYESAIERETERAVNQFQYDKFTVQSGLLSGGVNLNDDIPGSLLNSLSSELSGLAVFFAEDKRLIHSDLAPGDAFALPDVQDNRHIMQIQTVNGTHYITVSGKVTHNGGTVYLLMANGIGEVINQKDQMMRRFAQIFFTALLLSMALILTLSFFITRPVKRMDKTASLIAGGRYSERLSVSGGDEIGELSKSFNLMADAVEEKIRELTENARQKEDFIASFAHELKTPLTSVIGYADMLYQRKLPPELVKDAAWYILNEGLRLEALSLKLMDLIILNKQDFVLEEMLSDELFMDIQGGLKPMLDEKNVRMELDIEPAYVMVEYDLFKTLLLNLIDNAIKAGCGTLTITGKRDNDIYRISVSDDGGGIPASELARITEAFYTVDKSRSRRQHGLGLGLALVTRIAEIHGATLSLESVLGKGTTVTLNMVRARGVDYD
ncbi:MAG: HAMP domain-containing histidine kinase [Clostridiales bacterium]|jgi:signal transduction histidine kinase|nr:HAMP domain-containing histidine kinase [Clostridiales bacterium]